MKTITAIIKPFMLAKVQEALQATPGFPGMTVTDCRGIGHDRLEGARQRASEVEFMGKVKIEVVVADDLAERLAGVMARAAHTGNPGDGLIYLSSVDAAIRVKTFDKDEQA